MPKAVTVYHYQYDELSSKAKAKARDWYREASAGDEWWDNIFEDFERVAEALGIMIAKAGKPPHTPQIFFSGFWNQGDGASFAGMYRGAVGTKAIREYAPTDAKLHSIADALAALEQKHGRCEAAIRTSGHYSHEYSMDVEVDWDAEGVPMQATKELLEALRDLARWLYRALEAEYDHLNSDEQVEEVIRINEYEFLEDGRRAPRA